MHHRGVVWCTSTRLGHVMKKTQATSRRRQSATVRASISFPSAVYKALEDLAKQHKVSVAWIVRDAAERYVETQATGPKGVAK